MFFCFLEDLLLNWWIINRHSCSKKSNCFHTFLCRFQEKAPVFCYASILLFSLRSGVSLPAHQMSFHMPASPADCSNSSCGSLVIQTHSRSQSGSGWMKQLRSFRLKSCSRVSSHWLPSLHPLDIRLEFNTCNELGFVLGCCSNTEERVMDGKDKKRRRVRSSKNENVSLRGRVLLGEEI